MQGQGEVLTMYTNIWRSLGNMSLTGRTGAAGRCFHTIQARYYDAKMITRVPLDNASLQFEKQMRCNVKEG